MYHLNISECIDILLEEQDDTLCFCSKRCKIILWYNKLYSSVHASDDYYGKDNFDPIVFINKYEKVRFFAGNIINQENYDDDYISTYSTFHSTYMEIPHECFYCGKDFISILINKNLEHYTSEKPDIQTISITCSVCYNRMYFFNLDRNKSMCIDIYELWNKNQYAYYNKTMFCKTGGLICH